MNPIETVIFEYIETNLLDGQAEGLTVDTPLLRTGIIDSISAQRLFVFLGERFGVTVDDGQTHARSWSTIRAMAALVEERASGNRGLSRNTGG